MVKSIEHATVDELCDKMDWLLESPKDGGVVRGIVVRPDTDFAITHPLSVFHHPVA